MEFPTIRYDDFNGKPYTFAYGCWAQGEQSPYYDGYVASGAFGAILLRAIAVDGDSRRSVMVGDIPT